MKKFEAEMYVSNLFSKLLREKISKKAKSTQLLRNYFRYVGKRLTPEYSTKNCILLAACRSCPSTPTFPTTSSCGPPLPPGLFFSHLIYLIIIIDSDAIIPKFSVLYCIYSSGIKWHKTILLSLLQILYV